MPPKRAKKRKGGAVSARLAASPRIFVMPSGKAIRSVKYGGNFQNGTGWFSDAFNKVRSGVQAAWNTGKKVYEVAKKINPSKYLDMVDHPYAKAAASNLKKVGLGAGKRVMGPGNAAVLLR